MPKKTKKQIAQDALKAVEAANASKPASARGPILKIVDGQVYKVEADGCLRPYREPSPEKKDDIPEGVKDAAVAVPITPVPRVSKTRFNPHDPLDLWNIQGISGNWITEISLRPQQGFNCPKCGKPVMRSQLVKIDKDKSGEDIYGWHFDHPCGAKLLIIND